MGDAGALARQPPVGGDSDGHPAALHTSSESVFRLFKDFRFKDFRRNFLASATANFAMPAFAGIDGGIVAPWR